MIVAALTMAAAATQAVAQMGAEPDLDTKYATALIKPGTPAPDFTMRTIDGATFRLSDLRGRTVVLDFWASWCPDCRKDAPEIVRMHRQFGPQGVEFVGVSMDTDTAAWRRGVEKLGIKYTQVSELKKFHDTDISKAYGVKWIPSLVVVGPDGQVVLSTVLSYKVDKYLSEQHPTGYRSTSERVTIDGSKGKLQGILQKPVLAAGQQCPMVVLCHGFGGSKDGPLFELIADSLQANGIASLRFDFNGHGESEGDFVDMTVPNEIEDAQKVVEYVRDLRYINKVALVGHSQGGVVAAMTAGQLGADDIAAVALMAPAAVLRDDALRGSTMGATYNPQDPPESVNLWGGKKLGRKYIKSALTLPIYETAAKYTGPALVVHGTGDRVVPYTYGLRFHQQWQGSEYVELEYFDHGFTQNIYRATSLVSAFLVKTLKQ